MDRETWLRERQTGLGSSDAPNLVGVGYRTAADVYRSKVEPVDATLPESGVLRRGIDLETIVEDHYRRVMVRDDYLNTCGIVRHPQRPWQLASPDRRLVDSGRFVELKTTAGFGEAWGPNGSDQIPDGYRVQVQHQMGVLGVDSIDLAALDVIAWELRVYRIGFDLQLFNWLTFVEAQFWDRVQARAPVGPEWEESWRGASDRMLIRPGSRIDLGPEVAGLIEQRKALGAIRDEADDEYRRLTARLEALMGENERATAGPWNLKRVVVKAGAVSYERREYARLDVRMGKARTEA
jgi:putative phage-type endonuclease